jgi:predicted metal-dependent hydrolase
MVPADPDTSGSVLYGRKTIGYSLVRCARKTMEIAVLPDGSVVVKVPAGADPHLIEHKLYKRARWILRQQSYFSQFNPRTPARRYISGETHLYLGRQYRLKVSRGKDNSVKLIRGFFHITCNGSAGPDEVQRLLSTWYMDKARMHFSESLERCLKKFRRLGIAKPRIAIKRMRTRWGSLSSKGTLTLNADLIRAPQECIDYVVIHELCHLKHRDHGTAFYQLLDAVVPDWERIKHRLEISMA